MDDLTVARDTNRRLNRRLGDMEHHLHSMVSEAQTAAATALKVTHGALETSRLANSDWWKKCQQYNDLRSTVDRMGMWLFVVAVWPSSLRLARRGWRGADVPLCVDRE